MKFTSIFKVAAVLMAACGLMLTSCDEVNTEVKVLEVSLKGPAVGSDKGQQFVNVRCRGNWILALVAETGDVDWASLDINEGTGDKGNIRLSYEANTTGCARSFKIYLDDGARSVYCEFEQPAADSHPEEGPGNEDDNGSGDNGSSGGSGNDDQTVVGWLELPAMDNPDLSYYSHSFEMNGKTYRNYSFGYSNKDYLAVWVAYPLSKLYMNGSVGDFKWYDNPLVDDDYEPNFRTSFGYEKDKYPQTYERGHQIAKADRKCSSDACQQTYYYTNATLQMADFNGYVWAQLEANMRSSASTADTLYVVTGCTLSSSPKYIEDPSGHMVPVPSGYFKAAVRYHAASTISQWLGAAFYLDHDASKYPSEQITASESMSIDELEIKLGLDLFVNLPIKLGDEKAAAIEAQNPDKYSSVWGIR